MTMQTIKLLAASLIQFGILFQTLGTDAQKYISSYINLSCGQTSKGLRLEHSNLCFWIRSLTFIGALPLSTLNVWNNILYGDPKCTESQCGWNKTDFKYFLLPGPITKRTIQFCTPCRRFIRKREEDITIVQSRNKSYILYLLITDLI